jgi:uncharacterized protein YfaS (alpha-2-macroglobulin family)
VESGERTEVVIAIETKNDYAYLLFEDLKPAGFEAVEIKSGAKGVARAIKQRSYQRNYGKLETDAHARGLGASTDSIDCTGTSHGIYQKLGDRKIALFADKLEQGIWEIRYELRAEVPGEFHGLPVIGQAMCGARPAVGAKHSNDRRFSASESACECRRRRQARRGPRRSRE